MGGWLGLKVISHVAPVPSWGRVPLLSLLFLSFFFVFPKTQPALAHIEKDSTPDPVAKMEYLILLEFQPDNLDVRNKLGMVLLRLKELTDAAEQFNEVLKREPTNFNATDGMGLVFSGQEKYGEALARFDKAITINPQDAMVYYHRGQVLEALGRLQEAVKGYEKALSLFPTKDGGSKLEKLKKEVGDALQRLKARLTADASSR